MLRINQSRIVSRALGFGVVALFTIASGDAVFAKARTKKAVDELSMTSPAPSMTPPPVRFFTINSVLAKLDGGKPSNANTVASVDPSTMTDARNSGNGVPQTSDEPFGLFTFRAPEGILWTKWRGVQNSMRGEITSIGECRAFDGGCSPSVNKFIKMSEAVGALSGYKRIEKINSDVNQAVRYTSDFAQHGVADLWSAPLTTIASGQGDCEDYAILKYALLLDAGVDEADLKLLLVKDRSVGQDHAVLAVRQDRRWVVLDNRRAAPIETADLGHFMPLFALNQQGVSLFAAPYASRALHESEVDLLPASDSIVGIGQFELPILM